MSFVVEKLSIGEEIDRLFDLREDVRKWQDKIDETKKVIAAREDALVERLDEEGMAKAVGRRASVSITETIVPQVENWDEFYAFIHRNKSYHLLERRASAGAYRELLATRGRKGVPGVIPYTKRKLSLRTV